ncbi:O-methyltransferase [Algoriphagus boseongensis]|uniref:O-methyltransferase n=1 Tax=Algoriphagus boseongensis TaxID=1442587 RepID=UPI001FB67FB2|nr:class I SAM-dependent methyltransferase [Algoriphagus boseongensis]
MAFLNYWLQKEDQYSQQSPFVYTIYSSLLNFLKDNKLGDPEIESFRKTLLTSSDSIEVLDLGAGSKKVPQPVRSIKSITKYSTSSSKYAQIYQFFCGLTPNTTVIELGTCMGISTRYLAKSTSGKVYSFEGSEEILKIAQQDPLPKNIEFHIGPIESTLPEFLKNTASVDFALIDATHTYEGTISYFNFLKERAHSKSIFALGDIHWSKEMEKAWEQVKKSPEVRLTFDFFECGIVFFENPGPKSHLILSC